MNKNNYDNNNQIKQRKLTWKKSKNYLRMKDELSGYYRKIKEYRKRLHARYPRYLKTRLYFYFQKNLKKYII